MSILWGLRSGTIFHSKEHPGWYYFYQFTSNFVGCLAGWCCVYALAVRAQAAKPSFQSLNAGDAVLFLFAVLGLTGHFTEALVRILHSIAFVSETVIKKATS